MLSRNQLHTHAHRYGHATWKWIWRRLSWICGAKCEMRLSLCPTDAVLLSTCSLAQCPIAFGWAATWYAVAWRGDWAGRAGWDQLSTHGGRSVNCCGMRKMTLMSRLQLDLCLFFCIQFRLKALNWVMSHVCGGYDAIWMTKPWRKRQWAPGNSQCGFWVALMRQVPRRFPESPRLDMKAACRVLDDNIKCRFWIMNATEMV